jgi:hypothetical protein
VPFGRIPVRAEPDGWRLVPDPEHAPVVVELVRRYLAGDSFRMLSRWLSAEGIPAWFEYGFPRSGGRSKALSFSSLCWVNSDARSTRPIPHAGASVTWQRGQAVEVRWRRWSRCWREL